MTLADLGAACGACHRSTGGPNLEVGEPPASVPSGNLRMARHEWAASRMWLGLMQPSETAWKSGSQTFANATLVLDTLPGRAPLQKQSEVFTLAARAHAVAQQAEKATTAEERRSAFAQMYATCAECHAAVLSP